VKQVFNGKTHEEVPVDECATGDYIIYHDNGCRVGKVAKHYTVRKKRWIKTEEKLYKEHLLEASRKINPRKVVSAWRIAE